MNHTNNLRSSFGIAVGINGEIWKEDYRLVGNGSLGDGGEGLAKAQELCRSKIKEYSDKGIFLVLCAAEKYAGYVESKGRAVLSDFTGNFEQFLIKLK